MAKRQPLGMRPHLYAVILAGGSGTRFWPLSRQFYPKQLLRLLGEDTLIQQTMRRVLHCVPADRVLISTVPAQAESIRFQLGQWKDALEKNFVIEPDGLDTGLTINCCQDVKARYPQNGGQELARLAIGVNDQDSAF